jgi:hypothetical protein
MIQSREQFPLWLTDNGLTGTGVEVGVYFGQYSEHLLKNWPGKLHGIDPFTNYPKEEYLDGCNLVDLEEAFQEALKLHVAFPDRFFICRWPSVEASVVFEDASLDFTYLDGNHDYKHVSEDIRAWWPKVKSGGVLGGHDYMTRNDEFQRCGVEQAVHEFVVSNPGLLLWRTDCTSWWLFKP